MNNCEYIAALIKENEELIEENEAITNDYEEMKKTMLDERRQKNNLNHLYQKIKMDHSNIDDLKKRLQQANDVRLFDKERADNLTNKLNIARDLIKMGSLPLDKENILHLINWITIGGNLYE